MEEKIRRQACPPAPRGDCASVASTLKTSLALGPGFLMVCQLLLVSSEPLVNVSLLPPAMESLLRMLWVTK